MAAARSVLLNPESEAWSEFGGASNLIGWRFRACHEDMMLYVESWKKDGANVSFEEIYLRDRALFGMFTAGVSCIESTCYSLHALVSKPLSLEYGKAEQRDCNPLWLKKLLLKHPEARNLAEALNILTSSTEWKQQWLGIRNRMTHRSNLPRINQAAMGAEPPPAKALHFAATSSTSVIEADLPLLETMFAWLAQSLRKLLVEGKAFVDSL